MYKSTTVNINPQPIMVKPQYLTFLLMLYVTFNLAGNAVLFKLVQIGFLLGPGSIFVVPLILLMEDIIAEVYGYKISRALLWYILVSELLFAIVIVGIVRMPYPNYWHDQTDFNDVFGSLLVGTPTLIVANLSGRFLNLYVISKLKVLVKGRYFWMRSIFSSLVGDLVTLTILFSFLFAELPLAAKAHLYLSDLFMRVAYSIVGGGIGVLAVRYLKRKEGLDVYDVDTNFNPFKLEVFKLETNK